MKRAYKKGGRISNPLIELTQSYIMIFIGFFRWELAARVWQIDIFITPIHPVALKVNPISGCNFDSPYLSFADLHHFKDNCFAVYFSTTFFSFSHCQSALTFDLKIFVLYFDHVAVSHKNPKLLSDLKKKCFEFVEYVRSMRREQKNVFICFSKSR